MRPRKSQLGSAIAAIAALGAALAALWASTGAWWFITWIAILGAISGATLGALVVRGARRLPWLGFALFGWIFFVVTHSGGVFKTLHKEMDLKLDGLASRIVRNPTIQPATRATDRNQTRLVLAENGRRTSETISRRAQFRGIILLLLNIIFACVGGIAGRWFAARTQPTVSPAPSPAYTESKEGR